MKSGVQKNFHKNRASFANINGLRLMVHSALETKAVTQFSAGGNVCEYNLCSNETFVAKMVVKNKLHYYDSSI